MHGGVMSLQGQTSQARTALGGIQVLLQLQWEITDGFKQVLTRCCSMLQEHIGCQREDELGVG